MECQKLVLLGDVCLNLCMSHMLTLILFSPRCLFGEMKVRDAILKGTTEAEQLELIYKLFGTPTGTPDPRSQPPPHY